MSDEVVFQDEQANTVANIAIVRGAPKGMLAWLVKNQVVKNAKQGEQVLLGTAIIAIVLAVGIFYFFGTTRTNQLTSEQQQQLQLMVNEMKSSQHP